MYLAVIAAALASCAQALWPHPKSVTLNTGVRSFDPDRLSFTSNGRLSSDVEDAFKRFVANVKNTSIVGLNAPNDGGSSKFGITQIKVNFRGKSKRSQVPLDHADVYRRIQNDSIAGEINQPIERLNEKYTLSVPATGPIEIDASSSLGILRALTTLEQLTVSAEGVEKTRYISKTPVKIEDEPAFPYRGFLLDTARNYYSVASIKRQLEAASYVKLNQFHWHIVDSQSFPLVLPGDLAKLSEKGAYSSKQVYRPEDVQEIVDYANARGISVNVEIDMPGHTYAGVKDYDASLLVCPNKVDWQNWSNEPPSGQLNIKDKKKVYDYVTKVLTATAHLFPGTYFSTGNDEVNLNCFGAKNKSDIDGKYLKPFVQHAHKVLSDVGKTPMVWEEAVIDFPETGKALQKGTLVQTWISSASVTKVLAGNPDVRVINSPLDTVYLDLGRGEWLTGAYGQSYSPYCTWGQIYKFQPLNGTTPATAHRVVGSEALLWSEQSDEYVVDSLLWPRAAALAEVIWTGQEKKVGQTTSKLDLFEATARLNDLRARLVAKGIYATPLHPQWCDNEFCPNPSRSG